MDQKSENEDKKKSKKKRILILVILLLLLFIPALLFWGRDSWIGVMFFGKDGSEQNSSIGDSEADEAENTENDDEGGEAEENENESLKEQNQAEDAEMKSENYKVSQVKFGGNVAIDNGKAKEAKLEIYQVKSENTVSQEDDTPRILITWKTSKEATSTVSYAKIDGKNGVEVTEEGYGFQHSMLLKNMEFSTIYTYKIEAKDKWGNKASTEYFSAYTGDKSESIFDLITNAVEDVFGWVMK